MVPTIPGQEIWMLMKIIEFTLGTAIFTKKMLKRYLPVGMYREYLLQHYHTFLSHHIMNKYAKYRGTRIINKTKYSFIEDYDTEE